VTTLDDRSTPPSSTDAATAAYRVPTTNARLRVVLLLDVLDGKQQDFLAAYEQIRHQVAAVPGHISDQLCQSLGNSSQWLITSEWESSEPFLEWVESAAHRAMVEPLHDCVRDTTSLRYLIARETPEPGGPAPDRRGRDGRDASAAPRTGKAAPTAQAGKGAQTAGSGKAAQAARAAGTDPVPAPPLCVGGVVRHAITFTVRPGSEEAVAKLLSDYESPQARVDDTTRLLRTSLYMDGNRVVRAVEVEGDLGNALRHVAAQPQVRAVEEAINPYLEEDRDLTDAGSARAFFARAALPAVAHVAADPQAGRTPGLGRLAFLHPVAAEQGPAEARRLSALDAADCADPGRPVVAATVYQRGEVLVRLLDVQGPADAGQLARGGRPMALLTDRSAGGDRRPAP
jgi:heme-degrading monooxygenase HmoA